MESRIESVGQHQRKIISGINGSAWRKAKSISAKRKWRQPSAAAAAEKRKHQRIEIGAKAMAKRNNWRRNIRQQRNWLAKNISERKAYGKHHHH